MAGKRAAHRYAKALLEWTDKEGVLEKVDRDMRVINRTITDSKDLRLLLKSPIVKDDLKLSSLKAIFKDVDKHTTRMFDVLRSNKRMDLLPSVANSFISLIDARYKISKAVVTTAVPLTPEMKKEVLAKVKEITGQKADLTQKVDEKLIGGFLLRIGDLQYDASILGKLNQLKHRFNQNTQIINNNF